MLQIAHIGHCLHLYLVYLYLVVTYVSVWFYKDKLHKWKY